MTDQPTSNSLVARLSWLAAKLMLLAGFCAIVWYGASHSVPQPPTAYLSSELAYALNRGDSRAFLNAAAAFKDVDRSDDDGMTLLMLAVNKRNLPAVVGLLDRGADVNRACPGYGTPLTLALWWGDVDIARLLLSRGANPNVITREYDTPLTAAARNGSTDVVRFILPHMKQLFPDTALENPLNALAGDTAALDALRLLLKAGVDPNRAGRNGELPAVTAAAFGSPEAVTLLLRAGADPSKRNRHGTNVWTVASYRPEILEVLRRECGGEQGKTS
jgi:ankyrin repeat protein